MRAIILLFSTTIIVISGFAQVSVLPMESKLSVKKGNGFTELTCSGSTMTIKFQLHRELLLSQDNNFLTIDNQIIQITPLQLKGYKEKVEGRNEENDKNVLDQYSKYELEYFKNELGLEIKMPNNDWAKTKSGGWYIWYFRIGKLPTKVDTKVTIQLFSSTLIGDKILTLNAPILSDDDFKKAALIINDMMENCTIIKN